MRTAMLSGLVALFAMSAGCNFEGESRDDFWGRSASKNRALTGPEASAKAATRVHALGTSIVNANRGELGSLKPVFFTVGLKEPMIFHRDDGTIVLSEGLVDRCRRDEDLSAAICSELGKVAADHAQKNPPRSTERDLPPAPRITPDVVGGAYGPDMTRVAEAAMFEKNNQRNPRSDAKRPAPDPRTMAENFFVKAGNKADDYGKANELIKEAEDNGDRRDIMKDR